MSCPEASIDDMRAGVPSAEDHVVCGYFRGAKIGFYGPGRIHLSKEANVF